MAWSRLASTGTPLAWDWRLCARPPPPVIRGVSCHLSADYCICSFGERSTTLGHTSGRGPHNFDLVSVISTSPSRVYSRSQQCECHPIDEKARRESTAGGPQQSSDDSGDLHQGYENHADHDFHRVLNRILSLPTHWRATDGMETEGEDQVAQMECPGFEELRQPNSNGEDRDGGLDSKWLHRFMHHLSVVAPLPRKAGAVRAPDQHAQDRMSRSGKASMVELRLSEDQEREMYQKNTSHKGVPKSELVTRIWSGYWIGPDDEDGWGFVEAFTSPAEHGCPVRG